MSNRKPAPFYVKGVLRRFENCAVQAELLYNIIKALNYTYHKNMKFYNTMRCRTPFNTGSAFPKQGGEKRVLTGLFKRLVLFSCLGKMSCLDKI